MKGMTLTGKFVWVDGKRYFQDEVLGLIAAPLSGSRQKKDSLESPIEYVEAKVLTLESDVERL